MLQYKLKQHNQCVATFLLLAMFAIRSSFQYENEYVFSTQSCTNLKPHYNPKFVSTPSGTTQNPLTTPSVVDGFSDGNIVNISSTYMPGRPFKVSIVAHEPFTLFMILVRYNDSSDHTYGSFDKTEGHISKRISCKPGREAGNSVINLNTPTKTNRVDFIWRAPVTQTPTDIVVKATIAGEDSDSWTYKILNDLEVRPTNILPDLDSCIKSENQSCFRLCQYRRTCNVKDAIYMSVIKVVNSDDNNDDNDIVEMKIGLKTNNLKKDYGAAVAFSEHVDMRNADIHVCYVNDTNIVENKLLFAERKGAKLEMHAETSTLVDSYHDPSMMWCSFKRNYHKMNAMRKNTYVFFIDGIRNINGDIRLRGRGFRTRRTSKRINFTDENDHYNYYSRNNGSPQFSTTSPISTITLSCIAFTTLFHPQPPTGFKFLLL